MKAADNLRLHTKDGKPSPNIKGSKEIFIATGEKIPDIFIPQFLRYNKEYIADLKYNNGIPVLTKEEEKKYGVKFEVNKPKPLKIKEHKYTQEKLTAKLAELGNTKFKEWTEKEFGEDEIDRRKSSKAIIIQILKQQEENKR